jgi:hypothetical protein
MDEKDIQYQKTNYHKYLAILPSTPRWELVAGSISLCIFKLDIPSNFAAAADFAPVEQ